MTKPKQSQTTPPKTVTRTFDGLRDVLFDALEDLINGKTKPETANAVSRVASEITRSVSAQAEVMRLAGTKAIIETKVPGIAMLEKAE